MPLPKFNVKNSFEMKSYLKNIVVPNGYGLISIDALSLFTNITLEDVKKSLRKKKKLIEEKSKTSFMFIMKSTEYLYCNNDFQFDDKTY